LSEKGERVAKETKMDDFILIGVVRKVRGIKGDLKVESMSDFPDRFSGIEEVFIRKRNSAQAVKVEVEKSEFVNNYAVMKFKGVDSYDGASAFVGAEILVPESGRVAPPPGTYFIDSLIGMNVTSAGRGKIGIVKDVLSNLKQDMLLISMDDGSEFSLPFVNAFVKNVDLIANEITVELIDGLVADNRTVSEGGAGEN
jgi:16S rRNA processing protein RimM